MKYRPEIDGLRAIAVLCVVIYHAQFVLGEHRLLGGGFIGVDIFFVISGYLICTIVRQELASQQFSFAYFYERRARRILPALFAVMLTTIPMAWLLMLPSAFKEFAASILASLGFASNVLFWLQDSYTAEPSLLKPFLHTWSLSVEEQFYLIFPLLLLLLWRYRKPLIIPVLSLLCLVSLVTAQIGSQYFTDANFFLLPSRGWEMLSGALLALWHIDNNSKSSGKLHRLFTANALAKTLPKIGLAFILSALFLFDSRTPHPSLLTAFPVLGCVLIIGFAKPDELVTRYLSTPLLTGIGLISYSWYLWHFPLFAFARIYDVLPDNSAKATVIVLSFGLAIASYYWVEKPFRNRRTMSSRRVMTILIPCTLLIGGSQFFIYHTNGAEFRLGPVTDLFKKAELRTVANGNYGSFAGRAHIVNVGDSHAEVLTSNLMAIAARNQLNYTQVIEAGCPLVSGLNRFDDGKLNSQCSEQLQQRRLSSVKSYEDAIIVFSARWNLYLQGKRFTDELGNNEPGFELLLTPEAQPQANISGVSRALKQTIDGLLDNQQKVVLVYPIPEIGWNVPNAIKKELDGVPNGQKKAKFESLNLTTSRTHFLTRSHASYQLYDSLGDHPNLIRVYPEQLLCSQASDACHTHDNIQLYYYDDNHLTHAAAGLIARKIEQSIAERGWLKQP